MRQHPAAFLLLGFSLSGCLDPSSPAVIPAPESPAPPTFPQNWTWGMDVVNHNDTAVTLRWYGDLGLGVTTPVIGIRAFGQFNRLFDVPPNLTLALNATLTWPSTADLNLYVGPGDPLSFVPLCVSNAGNGALGDDGYESCDIELGPNSKTETWSVIVGTRHNLDPGLRFEALVRLRIL